MRDVSIRNGERAGDIPFTPERLPDLAGIDGGGVVPRGVSLAWNKRDDLLRPTRGWRAIAGFSDEEKGLVYLEFGQAS